MPVNADDLPAHVRAQLGLPAHKPKRGTQNTSGGRWRCTACDEEFAVWARLERHERDRGHHRFECVMP